MGTVVYTLPRHEGAGLIISDQKFNFFLVNFRHCTTQADAMSTEIRVEITAEINRNGENVDVGSCGKAQ